MSDISVVVVDDERYSRDELKHLLSSYDHIKVVGEADSGDSAVMLTLQKQPDVIFLDIEMPKMNGMQVAEAIKELKKTPLLVFATAYPNFAADAFRFDAVDYLVKPYDEEELMQTISRLENRLIGEKPQKKPTSPSRLGIDVNEEIIYLSPTEIRYVYRDDRVTRVVLENKEYETKTALKELEVRLKDYAFYRIHKSYLVNLDYVVSLVPWFNGAYQLKVAGRKELLSVSRNYVKGLRARLEL